MFLLAENYQPGMDPTGWWMSEKLDGIRAMWDAKTHRIISRNSNEFAAPRWFVDGFPPFNLDGELWLGRGRFDETSSIARSGIDKGWNRLSFMVFDIPEQRAGEFEQRQSILQELVRRTPLRSVQIVPQTLCRNIDYFHRAMDITIANGGEGLMLRKPNSLYVGKRSGTLLKVKRMHDAEARVIGYQKGEGQFAHMMGAVVCVTEDGVQFKVGSGFSNEERANPPPIGCLITYRYQEIGKSGSPRFPTFVRIKINE